MSKRNFEFTDEEKLVDILQSTKMMQNIYNTYSIESSSEDIEDVLEDLYLNIKDHQRRIFNLMNRKGWYKLEVEDKSKLTKAYSKGEQDLQELM